MLMTLIEVIGGVVLFSGVCSFFVAAAYGANVLGGDAYDADYQEWVESNSNTHKYNDGSSLPKVD